MSKRALFAAAQLIGAGNHIVEAGEPLTQDRVKKLGLDTAEVESLIKRGSIVEQHPILASATADSGGLSLTDVRAEAERQGVKVSDGATLAEVIAAAVAHKGKPAKAEPPKKPEDMTPDELKAELTEREVMFAADADTTALFGLVKQARG